MPIEFYISPVNPIRFYDEAFDYQPGTYYFRHMDDVLDYEQQDGPSKVQYDQKFTLSDSPMVQIMSDADAITATLVECDTDTPVDTFAVAQIATELEGQDFSVWQFTCDFMDEGRYYLRLTATKDGEDDLNFISEPMDIKAVHANTIRFEYTNSKNDFSIIFKSDFIGLVRCEADIIDFKPASDDTIYNDQIHSTTLIRSTPFRQFTLIIGSNVAAPMGGIPDYMVDIVNRVLSCDQVKMDGKYYTKAEGAGWDEVRPENYPFSAQRITINESENKFQLEFQNTLPTEDMAYVYRKQSYIGNTAETITISNIFKKYTGLVKLCFRNVGTPQELTCATTTTGSGDDFSIDFAVVNVSETIDINQFFASDKVVTISGFSGDPIDVFAVYEKLDAEEVGPSSPGGIPVGAVIEYEEQNEGDFELDFDIDTGLGREERPYYGWAICDGRHGTTDRRQLFSRGADGIVIPAGGTGGSDQIVLTVEQMPAHEHALFANSYDAEPNPGNANNLEPYSRPTDDSTPLASMGGQTGYDQYRMSNSTLTEATLGKSGTKGGGENIDIRPRFIDTIKIKKIF